MVSVRISSKDLDRIIVLRLLSLELQMTCSYHLIVVVSRYQCYWILALRLTSLRLALFCYLVTLTGVDHKQRHHYLDCIQNNSPLSSNNRDLCHLRI